MLVPFAVDTESFTGQEHWKPADISRCHKTMIETWKRIGVLVYNGEYRTASEINSAVDNLAEPYKGLWRHMLDKAPSHGGLQGWDGCVSPDSLDSLRGNVRVALMGTATVNTFSGKNLDEIDANYDIELCHAADAWFARKFDAARVASNAHIRRGEYANDVWATRFRALAVAKTLKSVHIVDRYAVHQSLDHSTGLDRFLALLDSDAIHRKNVTIYSQWPRYPDGKSIHHRQITDHFYSLWQNLPKQNIKDLTLRLWHGPARAKDRFVMFESKYAWELGHGMEPFNADVISDDCAATFKTWENAASLLEILDKLQDINPIHVLSVA